MLSLTLKGRYTSPQSTLWEDRVISYCSMLSLTLTGRYPPLVNFSWRQSDLFTVQCCHWHSKADIPPWVTVAVDRVISSLFNVVIETQEQIYPLPPFNTIRGQSDLFTVQCCHWHSKADIPLGQFSRGQSDLLYCSMLSLTLKGRYTPWVTVAEDRVISSLFNVVIDTQRQIYLPPVNSSSGQSDLFTVQCSLRLKGRYTPIQHYQRTEWSLHCLMLSLRLKGRYTPHLSSSKSF